MYLNTQLKCFSNDKKSNSIAIDIILKDSVNKWLSQQNECIQNFAKNNQKAAKKNMGKR